MTSFRFSLITSLILVFSCLFNSLHAIPLTDKLQQLSPPARNLLKKSTPAAPRFLAYNDDWLSSFPTAADLEASSGGFNVFALTFLLASGAVDEAQNWEELSSSQQASYLAEYEAAGISLIVSAFGSTDTPTSSGYNPVSTANTMAAWVIQYGLQGIDVDYEDFTAFNSGGGDAETWLIDFTQQLRTQLPQGEYILTHAPVAPWFSPNMWTGGGYLAVDQGVGSLIDWYNVQFYNQGATEYTTCSGLLTESSTTWPESALFQIAANGVSLDKLVIGKPGTAADASNGYIAPSTLATCIAEAAAGGWDAGVMVWQYPDATSAWITTVRGSTWPISGSPVPTTTITTTSTKTTSPTATTTTTVTTTTSPTATTTTTATRTSSSTTVTTTTTTRTTSPTTTTTTTTSAASPTSTPSGSCSGVSAWVNNVAYVSGNQVTYGGDLWTANQWNYDETPGGLSGAWNNEGACA